MDPNKTMTLAHRTGHGNGDPKQLIGNSIASPASQEMLDRFKEQHKNDAQRLAGAAQQARSHDKAMALMAAAVQVVADRAYTAADGLGALSDLLDDNRQDIEEQADREAVAYKKIDAKLGILLETMMQFVDRDTVFETRKRMEELDIYYDRRDKNWTQRVRRKEALATAMRDS